MATAKGTIKQTNDQPQNKIIDQLKQLGYHENSIIAALQHVQNKQDINEIISNIEHNTNFTQSDDPLYNIKSNNTPTNDPLYTFLSKHKDRLKDSFMDCYDALKKENMDLDEITEFAEPDLRGTLKASGMAPKSIGRLINVLRHYKPSIIYKQSQRDLFAKLSKHYIPRSVPVIKEKVDDNKNNKSMASKPMVNKNKVNDFFLKSGEYQPKPRKFEDLFYDIQAPTLMPSVPERLNGLVSGYVSDSLYDKYPLDLNRLIIQFLGNIILVFDTVQNKYRNCIQHQGTYIRRPGKYEQYTLADWVYVTICSSLAFNHSFNEFRIKCVKPRSDAIGILSDTAICKNKEYENIWCQKAPGNMYYYYGGGAISSGLNTTDKPPKQKKIEKWKKGDIITIKIDRKEWTVRFLKNDKLMGRKIKIISNMDYYPFVGTQYHDSDYQLLYS